MTFHDTLAVRVRTDGDTATVAMTTDDRHLNGHGFVHGGVLASLADIAMGAVVDASTPADAKPVTVSLVMTYLEPAPAGEITARATVARQGKRITITGVELSSADGTTVAQGQGTFTTV